MCVLPLLIYTLVESIKLRDQSTHIYIHMKYNCFFLIFINIYFFFHTIRVKFVDKDYRCSYYNILRQVDNKKNWSFLSKTLTYIWYYIYLAQLIRHITCNFLLFFSHYISYIDVTLIHPVTSYIGICLFQTCAHLLVFIQQARAYNTIKLSKKNFCLYTNSKRKEKKKSFLRPDTLVYSV